MKKFLYFWILPVFVLVQINCQGQQYPVFTQYYFNELVINPAYAGNHIQFSATSAYRNQWVNLPGAPRTFSISAHSSLVNKRVGVGLLINHDEIGSYSNDHIFGMYSYMLRFPDATLSMGLQAGFNIVGADFSNLDLQNPDDASFAPLRGLKPNFGAGLYFSKKNYFVGFSVPFIVNSVVAKGDIQDVVNEIIQRRYYFLRAGVILPLGRSEIVKINPSLLLRSQEGQPLSLDLNTAFVFYDVFSAGLSWRSGDSFISFVGIKLSEKFYFSYSYDLTSSGLNKFSNGSHEFMLNFRARIDVVHKNLQCPSYYHYRD
jgi:type IX secretion system PorP/SprF family membrane protein